jgi:hypothetical protein
LIDSISIVPDRTFCLLKKSNGNTNERNYFHIHPVAELKEETSMYEHLIIFKFQSNVTSAEQSELVNQLLAFKDKIPGINDLSAGVNTTEETQHIHGYTVGMRVTFENLQASREYLKHPMH